MYFPTPMLRGFQVLANEARATSQASTTAAKATTELAQQKPARRRFLRLEDRSFRFCGSLTGWTTSCGCRTLGCSTSSRSLSHQAEERTQLFARLLQLQTSV